MDWKYRLKSIQALAHGKDNQNGQFDYESEKTQDMLSEIWKEIKLFIMVVITDNEKSSCQLPLEKVVSLLGDQNQVKRLSHVAESWLPCISLRGWWCEQPADTWWRRRQRGEGVGSKVQVTALGIETWTWQAWQVFAS